MPRILLIDDNLEVRRSLARLLTYDGHSVRVAEDGAEGLRLLELEEVDLVVTDVLMPHIDGLEFLRQLRRMKSRLPVIVMSGGGRSAASTLYLDLAKHLGAVAVMPKPVNLAEMRAHIARLVGEAT